MNPLYRKMFRDPMASRKPQGILASSAPMMTAAQKAMAKNQPIKAQTGTSVNTQNYMSAIAQLTQQGDVQTLTNILQDTRLPTNVRTAARSAIGSLQPKPSVAKPTPSYFDPTLTRRAYDMNLQSSSPATSSPATSPAINGSVGAYLAQLAQQTSPINNPMMSPSFVADNIMKPGDYTALRQSMQEQLSPLEISLLESGIGGVERVKSIGRALLQGPIQAEKDFQTLTTRPSKLDMGEFEGLEDLPETPSLNLLPQSSSILQDDPALVEQEVITPDITDTGVGADMEETATTEPSLTDKARTKLNDMLVDLETNDIKAVKPATADVAGPKKFTRKRPLTIEEGTTPEATKIYEQVLPEKVSLSEVEEELKSQFDLDPSKYDEKKQNAFWLNLTMAGLAIAAGESDNALSNIAKGLMVGVDSYGKDLKDLNAQEREDQKEYRAAMRQLISDKRSENIAVAQMQNSWGMGMNQLNQQRDQFATEMEFNKAKQEWSQKMAGMQLTATITTDLAKLELQEETLDYTKTQDLLKNKLDAYMQSPEHVQTFISAGLMTIDPNTNMPAITTEGEEYRDIIIAAGLSELTTVEKSTDTSRAAAALTRVMLGQGSQNDISLVLGSYGEEIQEAGGLQEWINTIPTVASQTVPQTQNNNMMTQSGFTVIK